MKQIIKNLEEGEHEWRDHLKKYEREIRSE